MLIDRLNWRYATKKMDPARTVPQEKVDRILEAINLAPTANGIQPFEVIVVTNPELRAELRAAAYNQSQVVDGSHLLVFAAWDNYTEERFDAMKADIEAVRGASEAVDQNIAGLKARFLSQDAETNFNHAARQTYIAFGTAIAAAACEEVDATPMEGFVPAKVDEILGLTARGLRSVTLLPLGYRAPEGDWLVNQPKARRPLAKLVTEIA